MRLHKSKKAKRMRGSKTHGYGAKKKHRGSGHRGGFGMAGTGKRADSKKPSIWKNSQYFGKRGFKRKNSVQLRVVNIEWIEQRLPEILKKNKTKGLPEVDLKAMGYDKLLGKGKPSTAYNVIVNYASRTAIQKIEQAGGKLKLSVEAGQAYSIQD